jgi:hypothetical protein
MGISKLTYTLKGEVPPKWLLDEYVLFLSAGVEGCGKNSPSFRPSVA